MPPRRTPEVTVSLGSFPDRVSPIAATIAGADLSTGVLWHSGDPVVHAVAAVPLAAAVAARPRFGDSLGSCEEARSKPSEAVDVKLLSGLSLALIVGGLGGLLMWLALRTSRTWSKARRGEVRRNRSSITGLVGATAGNARRAQVSRWDAWRLLEHSLHSACSRPTTGRFERRGGRRYDPIAASTSQVRSHRRSGPRGPRGLAVSPWW